MTTKGAGAVPHCPVKRTEGHQASEFQVIKYTKTCIPNLTKSLMGGWAWTGNSREPIIVMGVNGRISESSQWLPDPQPSSASHIS